MPAVAVLAAAALGFATLGAPAEIAARLTSEGSERAPEPDGEDPGPLSEREAAQLAAERGAPVEATALTDERRVVMATPSGAFSAELSLYPARVKNTKGGWDPVDLTIVARPDGSVGPAVAPVPMSFSGGGDGAGLARMSHAGGSLQLGWRGSLPAPVLSGSVAVYRSVEPGVDLVAKATELGLSTYLVIHDAAAARNPRLRAITFDLNVSGAQVTSGEDGEITVRNDRGPVFRAEPAMAWDSAGLAGTATDVESESESDSARSTAKGPGKDPGMAGPEMSGPGGRKIPGGATREEAAAAAPLSPRGNRPPRPIAVEATAKTITLRPGTLLTDASTVYPLVLDPVWQAYPDNDRQPAWAMVWSNGQQWFNSTTQDPRVGYDGWSSATKKSRVFYRFSTSTLTGKKIDSVQLTHKLDHTVNQDCSLDYYGPKVEIHRSDGFTTTTTWANQPGAIGGLLAANNQAMGHDSYCSGTKNQEWSLGSLAGALETGIGTLNLRIRSEDETNRNGWRVYNNGGLRPALRVDYRDYPATPTNLSITHSNNWGAEGWYTRRTTPAVVALFTNPNAGPVHSRFEIWQGATKRWEYKVNEGTAPQWSSRTVPATAGLQNGGVYQLRAYGLDSEAGEATIESKTPAVLNFRVDTQAPAAPTVTTPAEANPAQKCVIGHACSFTMSGGSDVVAFQYGINTDTPVTKVATSGGALKTVTPTPATFGPGWFTAYALDKAGNVSAPRVADVRVESSRLAHKWNLDGDGADSGEHGGNPAKTYPLTFYGSPGWRDDTAMELDGSDRALNLDGNDWAATGNSVAGAPTAEGFDLRTDRDFALSAWVRLDDTGQDAWVASSQGDAAGPAANAAVMGLGYSNGNWIFRVRTPTGVVPLADPDDRRLVDYAGPSEPQLLPPPTTPPPDSYQISVPATGPDGQSVTGHWVHLVAMFDDRSSDESDLGPPEISLWVNGRKVAAVGDPRLPETVFLNRPGLLIGRTVGSPEGFWRGGIDDVRVFPGILDRGQVIRIASERRPL
ncbi:LamG-like jellyroll fold domain-containing protein [Sporichthya polymorpha]|uniref:LamG-like jellyroll fold domain-containing protein n=1 Tax=Sporichthya polymorpha TaxID=35751 RepID=UPI001469D05B|nr:LamG-like jellyroll fold domain-containing protein [Sporichthya polymorpha]